MQEGALCYVIEANRVLLIEKLRGLGAGLYNGPGGKLEQGETPREAAIRETHEEVGVTVSNPEKVGELSFVHGGELAMFVHVFRTKRYDGTPRPSSEARPEWFDRSALPYDEMWEDDHLWLPLALDGELFVGRFEFEGGDRLDDATFIDHELERVQSLA